MKCRVTRTKQCAGDQLRWMECNMMGKCQAATPVAGSSPAGQDMDSSVTATERDGGQPYPARKTRKPMLVLVCLYQDDITTVYVGHKFEQAKKIRDKLRAAYGAAAAFHTISLANPPNRWLRWEREIRASLGMDPDGDLRAEERMASQANIAPAQDTGEDDR